MWLADLFTQSPGKRFFDLLKALAHLVQEAANALERYVNTRDPSIPSAVAQIEKRGDQVLQDLVDAISDTFVTPLDRQDLYNLGEALDDMIDYLNGAAGEIEAFGVDPTPEMSAMCAVLVDAAASVVAAVAAVGSDADDARRHARAASAAENMMEDAYRRALATLFEGDDVRRMFKLREIYRHLSNSADRADAVGKLVGKIVVKTS